VTRRKGNWIGHIWRRNCLKEREGRIEVKVRRGRRFKQLLDDLTKKRGYCKLKEEALDHALWRINFERGYGRVVRQITG